MADDPARPPKRTWMKARLEHMEVCRRNPCRSCLSGKPLCVGCVNWKLVKEFLDEKTSDGTV